MADQRTTSPVQTDVTEHPMLDLVPLARARREVTHMHRQTSRVGKALQSHLEQTGTTAITAAAIPHNLKRLSLRVHLLADLLPPSGNRCHGKLRCVVIDAHAHPTPVTRHIEDT